MATTKPDATHLPPELIGAILDHTIIWQLVRCSHVCALWRAIARAHPVFWRFIELHTLTAGSLGLFLDRLFANTTGGSINILIRLIDPYPSDESLVLFRHVVMPAVQDNLYRIAYLRLDYSVYFFPATLDALTRPAPELKGLFMRCNARDFEIPAPRLPSSLLAGDAPNLQLMTLDNVMFPSPFTPIPVLQTVVSLRVRWGGAVNLRELLGHFPALQGLDLVAYRCDRADYVIRQPLITVDVSVFDTNYQPVFSAFGKRGLSAVQHVRCPAHGAGEWALELLGTFEGPLTLTLLDQHPLKKRDQSLRAIFSAAYSNGDSPTRSFDFTQSMQALAPAHGIFFTSVTRARVTILRMLSLRALIIPTFGEFPSCETLELRFDDRRLRIDPVHRQLDEPWLPCLGDSDSDSGATQFPAVRTILCFCDSPATITVETLSLYLTGILSPRPSLGLLRMTNIQITGDVNALKQELACEIEQL